MRVLRLSVKSTPDGRRSRGSPKPLTRLAAISLTRLPAARGLPMNGSSMWHFRSGKRLRSLNSNAFPDAGQGDGAVSRAPGPLVRDRRVSPPSRGETYTRRLAQQAPYQPY